MSVSFKDGTAVWRTAVDIWFNDAGTWRRLSQVWRNDGSAWRKVHAISATSALAVSASPSYYSVNRDTTTSGGNFAKDFVATPSGGAGGYAGAWTRLAVGPTAATATGASTLTLHLTGSWGQHANTEFSETWRYTVTDAAGATAFFDITLYVSVGDNR